LTAPVLAPYETRLAEATAEVRRAIEEQKPYRVMDVSYRYSVRLNELQDQVNLQRGISHRFRKR
jgi:hypothetical protein